jgi:hypothetical protein
MPVVTRRMRLMEGAGTLGGVVTHDAMDVVMEHLSLTECFHLRAISKDVRDCAIVVVRLWIKIDITVITLNDKLVKALARRCALRNSNRMEVDIPSIPYIQALQLVNAETTAAHKSVELVKRMMARMFDLVKTVLPAVDRIPFEPVKGHLDEIQALQLVLKDMPYLDDVLSEDFDDFYDIAERILEEELNGVEGDLDDEWDAFMECV